MNQQEYEATMERVDELCCKCDLTLEENDELDRLSDLICDYEDVHYPIDDATPAQILDFMMTFAQSWTTESLSAVSNIAIEAILEIRHGTRVPTDEEAKILAKVLHISEDVFK